MTDEDLTEWREHPVTARFLANLRRLAAVQKHQICEAFWVGSEVSPEVMARSKEAVGLLDDLETITIEQIEETERGLDEYERNQAGES